MTVLAPDFMTKMCKNVGQLFHCAVSKVFDRVKSIALWSANIRKLAKDHKGYGSAAISTLNLTHYGVKVVKNYVLSNLPMRSLLK